MYSADFQTDQMDLGKINIPETLAKVWEHNDELLSTHHTNLDEIRRFKPRTMAERFLDSTFNKSANLTSAYTVLFITAALSSIGCVVMIRLCRVRYITFRNFTRRQQQRRQQKRAHKRELKEAQTLHLRELQRLNPRNLRNNAEDAVDIDESSLAPSNGILKTPNETPKVPARGVTFYEMTQRDSQENVTNLTGDYDKDDYEPYQFKPHNNESMEQFPTPPQYRSSTVITVALDRPNPQPHARDLVTSH